MGCMGPPGMSFSSWFCVIGGLPAGCFAWTGGGRVDKTGGQPVEAGGDGWVATFGAGIGPSADAVAVSRARHRLAYVSFMTTYLASGSAAAPQGPPGLRADEVSVRYDTVGWCGAAILCLTRDTCASCTLRV